MLGVMCLLGAAVATATGMIYKLPSAAIEYGILGYNGSLVAIALAVFHWPYNVGIGGDDGGVQWFYFLLFIPVVILSATSALLTPVRGCRIRHAYRICYDGCTPDRQC